MSISSEFFARAAGFTFLLASMAAAGEPTPFPDELPAELAAVITAADGVAGDGFVLCQSSTEVQFRTLQPALAARGLHVLRLRPYGERELRLAVLWRRSDELSRVELSLPGDAMAERIEALQREGRRLEDLAAFLSHDEAEPKLRHAAVFRPRKEGDPESRYYLELTSDEQNIRADGLKAAGFVPRVLQPVRGPAGTALLAGVWEKAEARWRYRWGTPEQCEKTAEEERGQLLQLDVAVLPWPAISASVRLESWRSNQDARIRDNPENWEAYYWRGYDAFWLGREAESLLDFNRVIEHQPDFRAGAAFGFRALLRARAGEAEQAAADLQELRKRSQEGVQSVYFQIAAEAAAGRYAEAVAISEAVAKEPAGGSQWFARWMASIRGLAAASLLAPAGEKRDEIIAPLVQRLNAVVVPYYVADRDENLELDLLGDHPAIAAYRHAAGIDRYFSGVWRGTSENVESRMLPGLPLADHLQRCRELAEAGWRPTSIAAAVTTPGQPAIATSVWQRETPPESLAGWQTVNEAAALINSGNFDLAVIKLRHVLTVREKLYEPDHPYVLRARQDLAIALSWRQDDDEAVEILTQVGRQLDALPGYGYGADRRNAWVANFDLVLRNRAARSRKTGDWKAAYDHAAALSEHRRREMLRDDVRIAAAQQWTDQLRQIIELPDDDQAELTEAARRAVRAQSLDHRVAAPQLGAVANLYESRLGAAALLTRRARTEQLYGLASAGRMPEAEQILTSLIEGLESDGLTASREYGQVLAYQGVFASQRQEREQAIALFLRSAEVLKALQDDRREDYHAVLEQLAAVLKSELTQRRADGKLAEAAAVATQLAEVQEARYGEESNPAKETRWQLADLESIALLPADDQVKWQGFEQPWAEPLADDASKLEEARALLLECRRFFGQGSWIETRGRVRLATALRNASQVQESAAEQRQAAEAVQKSLGLQHPTTRGVVEELASLLSQAADNAVADRDYPLAIRLQDEIAVWWEKLGGRDNWRVVGARVRREDFERLGSLSKDQLEKLERAQAETAAAIKREGENDHAQALHHLTAALPVLRDLLGDDHQEALFAVAWMMQAYSRQGNYARVEQLLRPYLANYQRRHGADSPIYAARLRDLGVIYALQEEHQRAVPLLTRAWEIRTRQLGEEDEETQELAKELIDSLDVVAGEQRDKGDFEGSRQARQLSLRIASQIHGPLSWQAAAERADLRWIGQLQQLGSQKLTEVRERMRRLYEVFPRLESAGAWQEAFGEVSQIKAAVESHLGGDSWLMGEVCFWEGRILAGLGKSDESLAAYRAARDAYQSAYGRESPRTAYVLQQQALVEQTQKNAAGAERDLVDACRILSETLGEDDPAFTAALTMLASFQEKIAAQLAQEENFEAAVAKQSEAIDLMASVVSDGGDYRLVNLRLQRDRYERMAGASPEQRRRLAEIPQRSTAAWQAYDNQQFDEAVELFDEVRQLTVDEFGEESSQHATALFQLARALHAAGKYRDSERRYRQSLELRRQVLGDQHVEVAYSLNQLGWLLQQTNQAQAAHALHEEALKILRQAFGENHVEYAYALSNFGLSLQSQGKLAEAEPPLMQALEIYEQSRGREHPDYATGLNNLAMLRFAATRLTEAEEGLRQALAILRPWQDGRSVDTAQVLANLGEVLQKRVRLAEAEPFLAESLSLRKRVLGPDHPQTLQSETLLARTVQALKSDKPGVSAASTSVDPSTASARAPDLVSAGSDLGRYYGAIGDADRAIEVLRQTWDVRRQELGDDHARTREARNELVLALDRRARQLLPQGHYDEARRDWLAAVEMMVAIDPNAWQISKVRIPLAELDREAALSDEQRRRVQQARVALEEARRLYDADQNDAALALAEPALLAAQQCLGENSSLCERLHARVGLVLRALGRYDEAEPHLVKSHAIVEELYGKNHETTAWRLLDLGRVHFDSKNYSLAATEAREARDILEKLNLTSSAAYSDALRDLGGIYHWLGDNQLAEESLQKARTTIKTLYGEDSTQYSDLLSYLGSVYRENKEFVKAIQVSRESWSISQSVLGSGDVETLKKLHHLGGTYAQAGELDQAESILRQAIDESLRSFGDDHELVVQFRRSMIELLTTVAVRRFDQHRFADEARVRREIVALQTMLFEEGDWRIANGRAYLARAERLATLTEEQIAEYSKALQLAFEVRRLDDLDQYADALKLMEQVVAALEQHLGRESRDYAVERDFQGRLFRLTGDLANAEEAVAEAEQIFRRVLTPAHHSTLSAVSHLAFVRESRGDFDRALPLRRESVATAKAAWGESSPELATARERLMQCFVKKAHAGEEAGDAPAALEHLASAIDTATERYGEQSWRVIDLELERAALEQEQDLTPEDRLKLAVLREQMTAVAQHRESGRYAEEEQLAAALARQWQELLGETRRERILLLHQAGGASHRQGNRDAADRYFVLAREAAERILGRRHPDLATIVADQARLKAESGRTEEAQRLFEESLAILAAAGVGSEDNVAAAREEVINALATRIAEDRAAERYGAALAGQEKLAAFFAAQLGSGHWRSRDAARQAAMVERVSNLSPEDQARFAAADRLAKQAEESAVHDLRQAAESRRQVVQEYERLLGDDVPEIAEHYVRLGVWDHGLGELAQAEIDLRQALAVGDKAWGRYHPSYAAALGNLATVVSSLSGSDRAAPLFTEALELYKQLGEKDGEAYATLLINAGMERLGQADLGGARRLLYEGVGLLRDISGEDSVSYAVALSAVAMSFAVHNENSQAEQMLRRALAILEARRQEARLYYTETLDVLTMVVLAQGRTEEALDLVEQRLAALREIAGARHREVAKTLIDAAALQIELKEFPAARSLLDEAFSAYESNLSAGTMTDQQQLEVAAELNYALSVWMTLALRTSMPAETAYAPVLRWKGSGFSQQRRVRRLRIQPELFPKLDELESVSSRIAALETSIPSPAERIARDAELAELARRRDELDEELSQLSAAYREQKEQSRPVLADIQKLLNPEEVLVDLKEFNAVDVRGDEAWRVAAFVIRADAAIRLVVFDGGSAVHFGSRVTEWRKTLGRTAKARQAGLELFREFWTPLLLGDAKTVLLSPEGALARFPFAALPDETPDRYLIERVEVAVVPATSMLPELLQIEADEDAAPADLLLVGGVDYGESSQGDVARREGARSADAKPFENLPNSGDEVRRIELLFRAAYRDRLEVELLDQAEATESRFRIAAPRATFIHLAVHGFQSFRRTSPTANTIAAGRLLAAELNASGRSVGVHPGLLCGVALAGANSPATLDDRLADDGLLTGLEVSNLDLSSSRMVVLSACESGIGEEAAGEGMLTLQRAFAVAGARTTVSTLWPVYDDVTAALMVEFYQEMLKTDEPKRPLTALCAAQRAVLDHYDPATRQVRRSIKKPANDTPESEEAQRLPPVYWAGFMLSGRWR